MWYRHPQECAERRRLIRKLTDAINAVQALSNRMDTENYTELIQARAAMREATDTLEAHIKEHKCEP
jgi:hypothetical protein